MTLGSNPITSYGSENIKSLSLRRNADLKYKKLGDRNTVNTLVKQ